MSAFQGKFHTMLIYYEMQICGYLYMNKTTTTMSEINV